MDPAKDIYHKEETPLLARRKRRHSPHATENQPDEAATSPESGTAAPPAPAFRSRHSSHRHRSRQRSAINKWIWWAIGVVVILYFGALMISFFIRISPTPAAPPTAPAMPAAEPPPHVKETGKSAAERKNDDLVNGIRDWSKASKLLAEALGLRRTSQNDDAALKLREALKDNPMLAGAQMELADICIQQMKYDEAIDLLRKVLEAQPDLMRARLALANALADQRNYAGSLAVARWIIEEDPYGLEAHLIAATACMNIDQPGQAVDHLRKIINADRKNLIAQNMLAQAYTRLGQHDKALSVLKDVQMLDSANSMSYYNLAVCYEKQNRLQETLNVLAEAAGMFGSSFVEGWTRSADFDSFKTNADFQAFQKELAERISAPVTNAATEAAQAVTGAAPAAAKP